MAKLVDILARDLPIWPAHADGLHQSIGGMIYYAPKGSLSIQNLCIMERASDWRHGYVIRDQWDAAGKILLEKRALEQKKKVSSHQAVQEGATHWSPADPNDDRFEAYWRPDWKGGYDCWAVTACADGNKWQKNNSELPVYAIALPTTWDGAGLPPVGTDIEYLTIDMGEYWCPGKVSYIGPKFIVITYQHPTEGEAEACMNHAVVGLPLSTRIRKPRTPEQIAKEARSKACDKMYGVILDRIPPERRNNGSDICEALYDEGYRKIANPAPE